METCSSRAMYAPRFRKPIWATGGKSNTAGSRNSSTGCRASANWENGMPGYPATSEPIAPDRLSSADSGSAAGRPSSTTPPGLSALGPGAVVGEVAVDQGIADPPLEFESQEGCVLTLALERFAGDAKGRARVEHADVGRGTDGERAGRNSEYASGIT